MDMRHAAVVLLLAAFAVPLFADDGNPNIDMKGFLDNAREAARLRGTRRLSEEEFIRMAGEPGTIVLDARSRAKFDELHVAGAVNLSFPDLTAAALAALIPDKETRILIYCNNNFVRSEKAFPSKAPSASLNLSTYVALYSYGYRNVWELAPRLDPASAKLRFEGTLMR
jgi:hypothetical protein